VQRPRIRYDHCIPIQASIQAVHDVDELTRGYNETHNDNLETRNDDF
jgi:hypothetical protein